MAICELCDKKIRPWFKECYECHNTPSKNSGRIPEPIVAREFMQKMRIDSWR